MKFLCIIARQDLRLTRLLPVTHDLVNRPRVPLYGVQPLQVIGSGRDALFDGEMLRSCCRGVTEYVRGRSVDGAALEHLAVLGVTTARCRFASRCRPAFVEVRHELLLPLLLPREGHCPRFES